MSQVRRTADPSARISGRWLASLVLLIVVAASLAPAPAGAIVGGQLTGSAYSNVAYISIETGADVWSCTGTLVSPTVVLTAAHCVGGEYQVDDVQVSFAPHVDLGPAYEVVGPTISGTASFDPRYVQPVKQGGTKGFIRRSAFDLGVVVLDRPAADVFPGIVPAVLPQVGAIDAIIASTKGKRANPFTAVGYGITREPNVDPHDVVFTGDRRMATPPLAHLDSAILELAGNPNPSWGDGGTCFGDSGGPVFGGTGPVIVAVFSYVQDPCHNIEGNVRLDTASARSFLARYLPLP